MNIEISGELSGMLEILKQMALFETKIAELYSICASTWKEDGPFWLDIWRDELRHARHIEQMMDIIRKKPERFQAGRPFNVHALATVVRDIVQKTEMVRNGELTKEKFLFIAQSYEEGYIEDRYGEVVKTDDVEYQTLMREVVSDTRQHKDKIIQQIIDTAQKKGYIKT
jgi:hypothetical protein